MITIPTLQQLKTQIISNLESQYGANIPPVGKSAIRTFAIVFSGIFKLIYLAIADVQKNVWPDTADPVSKGGTLERFGLVKLGRNPFKAVAGQYEVIVTGEIGAVIPASTTFKSDDDSTSPGYLFILDNEFTFNNLNETITLRALTPGTEAILNSGDTLTVTSPIADVDNSAEVYATIEEPLAAEEIEDYRQAIIDSFRLEPKGGAATDYILWALDAQGVETVYPYAKTGYSNEIVIYVEATIVDSTDQQGTPSVQLLSDVEDVIEYDPDTTLPVLERGRRPLGVFNIDFLAITVKDIDIEIVGWTSVTNAQQTAVDTALRAMIAEIRPYVAAAYPTDEKNDILDTNKIIAKIIEEEPTANFTGVNMYVDNVQLTTYQFILGNIPFTGDIDFI